MENRIIREIRELISPGRGIAIERIREGLEGWRSKA
jgi:hypothetical protein